MYRNDHQGNGVPLPSTNGGRAVGLSIIIPSYNVAGLLPRCVAGLLKQLGEGDELIVVDDGSTDETGMVADELGKRDARIRVYHKPNGGLSDARNYGLHYARGDYVAFVDSDDYVADAYMAVIHANLADHPQVLGFGYCRVRNGQTEEVFSEGLTGDHDRRSILEGVLPAFICPSDVFSGGGVVRSAWAFVYERSFLEERHILFQSEREVVNEDYLFNLEVLACAERLRMLHVPLYMYEIRTGSLSQQYHPNLLQTKDCLYGWYEKVLEKAGLHDLFRDSLLGFRIVNFYECLIDTVRGYSPLTQREKRRRAALFLKDERLHHALAAYPKERLTRKGKMIFFMMRHRMAGVLSLGYQTAEKTIGVRA